MRSEEKTEALLKRIETLEQQLKTERMSKVQLKVSQKGAIQINGIRRLPITLYRSEIETIFSMKDDINTFIEEHKDELAMKGIGLEH